PGEIGVAHAVRVEPVPARDDPPVEAEAVEARDPGLEERRRRRLVEAAYPVCRENAALAAARPARRMEPHERVEMLAERRGARRLHLRVGRIPARAAEATPALARQSRRQPKKGRDRHDLLAGEGGIGAQLMQLRRPPERRYER